MRKLHHPIAVFVVAVLAVIGIGVGVVAATTSQKVYGPSWGRFSAAFSGRASAGKELPLLGVPRRGIETPTTVSFFAYKNFTGWTGYEPLTVVDSDTVLVERVSQAGFMSSLRQLVRVIKDGFLSAHVTEDVQHANGFLVVAIGPACTRLLCQGALLVSNGRTLWELSASSPGQSNQVQDFFASFQPVG